MYIDDKLPEGYVVVCNEDHGDPHSFLIKNLGLSVQCPKCGHVAMSVDLATQFVIQQAEPLVPSGSGSRI